MKKSRFSEHQIIKILKEVEAGRTAKDVCRESRVMPRPVTPTINRQAYAELARLAECKNNPGELRNTPNCVNAFKAAELNFLQGGKFEKVKEPDFGFR